MGENSEAICTIRIYHPLTETEYLKLKGEPIDVLHLHEWHTALCAPLVKTALKELQIGSVLLTIHNLEYQGRCAPWDLDAIGLKGKDYLKPHLLQDDDPALPNTLNLLKGGIVFADAVNTVSPTYAREIIVPGRGFGLDKTLMKQKKKLSGILNGIDQKLWNPETDPLIKTHYSSNDSLVKIQLAKGQNRADLEKRFNIPANKQPWVGCVTRIVPQKGPELLEEAIHYTLSQGGVFTLLGSSPIPELQRHFEELKEKYINRPELVIECNYDEALAHKIYTSLDFVVIPSHFEPCGLAQLIAMRYGTIPIARATGGLKDTVFDCNDHTVPASKRNGFSFEKATSAGIIEALKRAFELQKNDPATFQSLLRRAIQSDFSWKKPAQQYMKLYQKIAGRESSSNTGGSSLGQVINFREMYKQET